jgi:SAM-dependent methyltransferase
MAGAMEFDAYFSMAKVEAQHWWFRGRRAVLAATIRRLKLRPGAKILELGSGTGGNLAMLSVFGDVTAVEMHEPARALARAKHNGADIRAGYLPDGLNLTERYDLIALFDVLEHIDDDEAALVALRRHLAPGGRAVITVPAYAALFGPHDIALHHKRRYEKAELSTKLQQAGLSVQQLTFINTALLPVALAVRVAECWLRRPKASGNTLPPAPLNALFARLFAAEAHLLPFVNLPCGLSLLAVVSAAE